MPPASRVIVGWSEGYNLAGIIQGKDDYVKITVIGAAVNQGFIKDRMDLLPNNIGLAREIHEKIKGIVLKPWPSR